MSAVESHSPPTRMASCLDSFAPSVVVPVGPGDGAWRTLLADLAVLPADAEIHLVATEPEPAGFADFASGVGLVPHVRWLIAPSGRASQQNAGARRATRSPLWFLHSDSRVSPPAIAALASSFRQDPTALHYFDLRFADDGPTAVRLNQIAANLRSRWLGLPFGDQGFCLARDVFARLGPFDEQAAYGEDHLLVWTARHRAVPLRRVGAPLVTSARKYRDRGWLRTTARHVWLTLRQALPQLVSPHRSRSRDEVR